MGLLSDPSIDGGWLGNFLLSHHKILALFLYLSGTLWFLGLAHNSLNHGTYFSENALLPGLVQGEFMGESRANRYLQELEKESEKYPTSMPHTWLLARLTQIGLDTYTHNFVLNYPMSNKSFTGRNVYGILRAVRAASTESIIVSAPYRAPHSVHPTNAPAVALMLAMAHFFAEQVYWAKDIIFLLTEHEQLGAEAWLQAYHGVSPSAESVLIPGTLPARAGPIQAAVNLEISSSAVSHVDIRFEGLNGQLPNLDLVNLLHKLCHRENVRHTIKNRPDHPRPGSWEGWLYQLTTLASSIATQASGVPSGNHGLFHRYGIAAVTVSGERGDPRFLSSGRVASLLQLGRVLEGTCRSLNNLLERFHQSFFFYLLPATDRYISIGVYMPAFGVMASSLLLIALALWCSSSLLQQQVLQPTSTDDGSSVENKVRTESKADADAVEFEPRSYSLVSCGRLLVLVHCLSLMASWAPCTLAAIGAQTMGLRSEDSVMIGLLAYALVLLLLPRFFLQHSSNSEPPMSWHVLKCVAVLQLATLVFAGAVHNFSLALIVTFLYTPVVMVVSPSRSRLLGLVKKLSLLAVHPFTLMVLFSSLDTLLSFPEESVLEILSRCMTASKHALMYSVVDSLIYGNWVFSVACCCLLPVWLQLWHILHCQPDFTSLVKLKTD